MALATTNVEITTDSFQNWLDKTNTLLDAYSTTIVTTAANSTGGFTTGNATVNGIFTANSITVSGNSTFGLRGGNVTTANVLFITGNVSIGNATVNTVFNTTTIDTDLALTVLGATTLSNSLSVAGNSSLSGQLQSISGNANFDAGTLFVDATNNRVGINNTAPGVALRVTGDVDISATANIQGAANVGSTLGVVGALTLSNTISVTGNTILSKDVVVSGNTFLTGNVVIITPSSVSINTSATFKQSSTFEANATFTNNVFVQGNLLSINVANFITASNGDLGSNTTTPLLVMSVPKSTYKGGELIVNVTKTGTSQVSKILFAHDESNVDLSTYGTVVAPISSPELASFTATINNANVEIKVQQTNINSAVKIMANLF
jgi:hypothetical protein